MARLGLHPVVYSGRGKLLPYFYEVRHSVDSSVRHVTQQDAYNYYNCSFFL